MIRTFVVVLACVAGLSSPACGQCRSCLPATLFSWSGERSPMGELSSIVTDRPDFTEASSTVGLGVSQLEMGYTITSDEDQRSHSWGEPLLRHGMLANWLEFRLAVAPTSSHGASSASGTEDLYLGTKIALTPQEGWLPETAIVPQMTVPTGSSAFSAGHVLPGANLLYAWDITDELSFGGSTQYNRAADEALQTYDEWAQSLTVGRSISEQLGTYLEWYALMPTTSSAARTEHYLNGGFTFLLTDDVQFDIRAGKGLNPAADDYFLGSGVSLRFK